MNEENQNQSGEQAQQNQQAQQSPQNNQINQAQQGEITSASPANSDELKIIRSQMEITNAIYRNKMLQKLDLNSTTSTVLFGLSMHYNPRNEFFFPSYDYLAEYCNVSRKSVERAIQTLKTKNVISVENQAKKGKANLYKFTNWFLGCVNLTHPPRQFDARTPRQFDALTNNRNIKKNSNFQKNYYSCSGSVAGKSNLPSAEETTKANDAIICAREENCSPRQYTKDQAVAWYNSTTPTMRGTAVSRYLIDKYGLDGEPASSLTDEQLKRMYFPREQNIVKTQYQLEFEAYCDAKRDASKRNKPENDDFSTQGEVEEPIGNPDV